MALSSCFLWLYWSQWGNSPSSGQILQQCSAQTVSVAHKRAWVTRVISPRTETFMLNVLNDEKKLAQLFHQIITDYHRWRRKHLLWDVFLFCFSFCLNVLDFLVFGLETRCGLKRRSVFLTNISCINRKSFVSRHYRVSCNPMQAVTDVSWNLLIENL